MTFCVLVIQAAVTKYPITEWVADKEQECIAPSSSSWMSEIGLQVWIAGAHFQVTVSSLYPSMWTRQGSPGISLLRALILFVKAQLSFPSACQGPTYLH